MTTITASKLTKLIGKNVRSIQRTAIKENWPYKLVKGRGVPAKHFYISGLPEDISLLIYKERNQQNDKIIAAYDTQVQTTIRHCAINSAQRDLAMAKYALLSLYIRRVNAANWGKKAFMRDQFILAYNSKIPWPQLYEKIGKVSWKTIEGWKHVVRQNNGDSFALADHRGHEKRGNTTLTPEITGILLNCVLNPNRPKVAEAIRMARAVMAQKGIQNGHSEATYRRWINEWKSINYHLWVFSREGAKAWNDKVAVPIERNYDQINVGDILVADGHTLNFEIINPWTGKPKRMTLLVWLDMKSAMPCGWEIMPTENTASIASALRRAILRLGKMPQVAYLDNGKAFAGRFFNGADLEEAGYDGLFERLGIKTIFAWPYHGQSKTVERFFGTFAELERWCPTYTGTSIDKKPPRLNRGERLHRAVYDKIIENGGITLEQAHRAIAAWFDEYAMRPQRGHLEGQCPMDVFLPEQGPGVNPAELQFLMMDHEIRTLSSSGIRFQNQKYYHPALYGRRHPVVIRYDLQNMDSVLVFDKKTGKYICEASPQEKIHPAARILGDDTDVEKLSNQIALKKSQEKQAAVLCRDLLENEILPEHRRQIERIAGPAEKDGKGEKFFAPTGEIPEKTEAEIMAEYEQGMAETAKLREIEKAHAAETAAPDAPEISIAEIETAGIFRRMDAMQPVDQYEALIELDVRGILIPKRYQYFMQYFENMPSYEADRDYYDTLRAQAAEKWQINYKKEDIS